MSPTNFEELERSPYVGLLKLAYPLIVAFSIQTGFNVVDTIFVGRIGPDAIAALSLAYPFQMIMYAIGGGLGIGAQSLISRSIGARNLPDAKNAAMHSIMIALLSGLLTGVIGIAAVGGVLRSFGAPESVNVLSLDYLYIVISGSIFLYLMLGMDSILRGEGNTKLSMAFMTSSALLNIFLDPIFIFALDMGVAGAAIATVLARALVVVAMAYFILIRKGAYAQPDLGSVRVSRPIIREIVGIGIPASLSQLSYSLSLFVMNTILATYGADAIATFGIGFRIESMAFLPMFGMAGAFVSAVGFFRGSGQISNLFSLKNFAYSSTIAFMSICAVAFFIAPERIYGVFTDSPTVISMGRSYLLINIIVYPIVPFTAISAAGFQGLGKGNPPMIISLLRSWLIVIPLSLIFSFAFDLGITYIWWSMVIGNTVSAIAGGSWFLIETRRLRNGLAKVIYNPQLT
ncbi:MAG: MATE family efflux transporter [Candidatus Methanofastidiosa archaeon]|nr:MATE family efflux transporter [Candidatus Methanofastidiosa archaeon]